MQTTESSYLSGPDNTQIGTEECCSSKLEQTVSAAAPSAPPQQCGRKNISRTAALCDSDRPHKCLCVSNWDWEMMCTHLFPCPYKWGALTGLSLSVGERKTKVFALISEWEWWVRNDYTVKMWFLIIHRFKLPGDSLQPLDQNNLNFKLLITDRQNIYIKTWHCVGLYFEMCILK